MTDPAPEITPSELVDTPKTNGALVPAAANAAIDAAAQAAVELPGVPGRDEFLALAMQARMLSMSGAAPEAIRDNPYVAFHVAMVGRDLGISPSAAIELIDVINTSKGPRLSLSPQLINGQLRRLGVGSVVPAVRYNDRAVALAVGPGGFDARCRRLWPTLWPEHAEDCSCDILGESEFTWEDARMAELVGPNCQPGNHVKDQNRSSNGRSWTVCGCNQGYITYPKRMLWWRTSGFAADDYFPEAGLGLYMPEALGALVDEDGRPVDPSTVALPEGYPEQRRTGSNGQTDDTPADPTELWALQERIQALPDKLRSDLGDAWKGDQSRVRGHRAAALPARLFKVANAMVNGHEAQAKSAGIDLGAELTAVREAVAARLLAGTVWAPQMPQDAPGPIGSTGVADDGGGEPEDEQDAPGEATDDDGRDWSAEMRNVAARVREVGAGVSNDVLMRITAEIKNMHHATLDKMLREAKIPTSGPIDLRRMHLALHKMRLWIAETRGTPPETLACEHGYQKWYCTTVGCPHAEEPF